MQRATKEYVTAVIQAREECDAAHAQEKEVRKQAIKTSNNEDPTVRLLKTTCQAARVQANQYIEGALSSLGSGTTNSECPKHSYAVQDEHLMHDQR